jgi:CYTH domain-containing protein
MGTEIERKFLVRSDAWRKGPPGVFCRQGYLLARDDCTVRVRVAGDRGYLTIKGPPEGLSRPEFEYPVPVADANELLDRFCPLLRVDKRRYLREHAGHTWEIDEFLGANAGLVVAEVELEQAAEPVALPDWVGTEVSADPRYQNSNLAQRPYREWGADRTASGRCP